MIISKEVEVKIGNRNYKYYRDLGYKFRGVGDVIFVDIKDLSNGSHAIIKCKCQNCEKTTEMMYKTYKIIEGRDSFMGNYYCMNCEFLRLKEAFSEKYFNQEEIDKVVDKRKKKWIEIYGVDNPMKSKSIREKVNKNNIEKYGVKWHISSISVRHKSISTMLKRYGVKYAILNYNSKEKMINTLLKRYGVKHCSYIPGSALNAGSKSLFTKIKRGLAIDKSDITKWHNYREMVKKITYRNKKKLFENWDGYDYYDNEYIKNNLTLDYKNKNYPCIDHKVSVLYGFKNQINIYEISDVKNLCITKRCMNSRKSSSNEIDFNIKNKKS